MELEEQIERQRLQQGEKKLAILICVLCAVVLFPEADNTPFGQRN